MCAGEGAVLRSIQNARVQEALDKYRTESAAWAQVTFSLRHRAGLGDSWKVVGSGAELGSWLPDVAPRMHWREGDVWTTVVRLPPGEHEFKAALRATDGTTTWEAGPDRAVVVPPGGGEVEVVLDVHMPWQVTEEVAPAIAAAPAAAAAAAASPAPVPASAPTVPEPVSAKAVTAEPVPAEAEHAAAPVAAAAPTVKSASAAVPAAPAAAKPGKTTVQTEHGKIVIEETTYINA